MHDTIGCYLDLDKAQMSFSKNGAISLLYHHDYTINLAFFPEQVFYGLFQVTTSVWLLTSLRI